jgi:hypothetical protein
MRNPLLFTNYLERRRVIVNPLLFMLIILLACNGCEKRIDFKTISIEIPKNGVLKIRDCAKWYVDFGEVKKTLIYKDKIISVGLNGGFACLSSKNFQPDTTLERIMNTDFFTNAAVYQDTLFAEKFDKYYYWDSNSWIEYSKPLKVAYFTLLYDDKNVAFYSACGGEFGSILFVYNKETGETRILLTTCPDTVLKTDKGYFIGTHLYHMSGFSGSYFIKNLNELPLIPDSLLKVEELYDPYLLFKLLRDTTLAKLEIHDFTSHFRTTEEEDPLIIASFNARNELFHILDPLARRGYDDDRRLLARLTGDEWEILDTLSNCNPVTTFQFKDVTILNETHYGNGFTLIRNDTIFKITYATDYPGYYGPTLEGYNISSDNERKMTAAATSVWNATDSITGETPEGQPRLSIEFDYKNRYRIMGYSGNNLDGNYIIDGVKKHRLKLQYDWSYLKQIFTDGDRLFVFFSRWDEFPKYGLIEITDIDEFVKIYEE